MPYHPPVARTLLTAVVFLPFLSVPGACAPATNSCSNVVVRCSRQGNWWVAVSANFQVCSLRGKGDATLAAERCEEVRASLLNVWQLSGDDAPWIPKCQVILYPDARSYVAAAGRGSEVTVGASLVKPRTGAITSRLIELRSDVPRCLDAALPHEICHLLVADRFRERPAPLWYDEGLALLVDPPEKLRLHERDLRNGPRLGTAFRISEILSAERYPEANRMGAFYGQCAALTQLLLNEGQPARIHEFASLISAIGVNPALRKTYDIAGVPELELIWERQVRSSSAQAMPLLPHTRNSAERFRFASVEP